MEQRPDHWAALDDAATCLGRNVQHGNMRPTGASTLRSALLTPGGNSVSDVLEARWRISDQAIANAVADETVILHLGNGNYFGLNPIGARLWSGLEAGEKPIAIFQSLLETYDVAPEELALDLRALLDEMIANNLIEPA